MKHRLPSFDDGFARSMGEAQYPDLWNGLLRAYCPQIGMIDAHATIYDFGPYKSHGTCGFISGGAQVQNFVDSPGGQPGWTWNCNGQQMNMDTKVNNAFLDFGFFVRFKPSNGGGLSGRILDKSFSGGTYLAASSTTNTQYGGGVKETSAPFGRFLTFSFTDWHSIVSMRKGTTHTIVGDASSSTSGTVTGAALDTTSMQLCGAAEIYTGRVAEVLIYDRYLTDGEIELLHLIPCAPLVLKRRRLFPSGFIPDITGSADITGADGTISGSTTVTPTVTGHADLIGADGDISGTTTVYDTITGHADITGANGTIAGTTDVQESSDRTAHANLIGQDGTIAAITTVSSQPGLPGSIPVPLISRRPRVSTRNSGTIMDSGRRRLRRIYDSSFETIDVEWNFTLEQYQDFLLFFSVDLRNGERSWILETTEPSDNQGKLRAYSREVAFMDPNLPLNRSDNLFHVSGTLEVLAENFELQDNPLDPIPPPVEFSDEPFLTYDSPVCRDSFNVDLTDLHLDIVYMIEISDHSSGPWVPHIYFKLLSGLEKSSKSKRVVVNNDYGGLSWFRVSRKDGGMVRNPQKPLAASLQPPEVTIDGLTEITEKDSVASPYTILLLAMKPYYDVPLSGLEVPTLIGGMYIRLHRKYAGRFIDGNTFGNLEGDDSEFFQEVHISSPDAVPVKWTQDNTDPQEDSPTPRFEGEDNNAAVHKDDFGYFIRARCFNGTCRSPLTIVAVDKLMEEKSGVKLNLQGSSVIGSCDATRMVDSYGYQVRTVGHDPSWGPMYTDPINGPFDDAHTIKHEEESGRSCKNFYGGVGGFMDFIQEEALGGDGAISGPANNPLIYNVEENLSERVDYLGWTNEVVSASGFNASSGEWIGYKRELYSNLPSVYNWLGFMSDHGVAVARRDIPTDVLITGPDAIVSTERIDDIISDVISGSGLKPSPPEAGIYHLTSFNVIFSGLPWNALQSNARDVFWLHPPSGAEDLPPDPIPPDPDLVLNVDNFESYPGVGDATTITMDQGNGFVPAGHWHFNEFIEQEGGTDFEGYRTVGAVTDPSQDPSVFEILLNDTTAMSSRIYMPFMVRFFRGNGDEGFAPQNNTAFAEVAIGPKNWPGGVWTINHFSCPGDDFQSYPEGPVEDDLALNGSPWVGQIPSHWNFEMPSGDDFLDLQIILDKFLVLTEFGHAIIGGQSITGSTSNFFVLNCSGPSHFVSAPWQVGTWKFNDFSPVSGMEDFETGWVDGPLVAGIYATDTGTNFQPTGWRLNEI